MSDFLADAPFVGHRETPYTGEHIVAYVREKILRYWYHDWERRASVQAAKSERGEWSVSVTWPDVEWTSFPQQNGSVVLARTVPDLEHPGEFAEETRVVPAVVVPTERPRPAPGRKVRLPDLDAEELSTLLDALAVYAKETGRYGHNVAYLERVLRRSIKESEGGAR